MGIVPKRMFPGITPLLYGTVLLAPHNVEKISLPFVIPIKTFLITDSEDAIGLLPVILQYNHLADIFHTLISSKKDK